MMTEKLLWAVKLNQKYNKYLGITNTTEEITTVQRDFDYALFFLSEDEAKIAVAAYFSQPTCRMDKDNNKFISYEPYSFEYDPKAYNFMHSFKLLDTTNLKDKSNSKFALVAIELKNFKAYVAVNCKAYT